MGRFHRHDDGTEHSHDHGPDHEHEHHGADAHDHAAAHDHGGHDHGGTASTGGAGSEHGDHSGYQTGGERIAVLERIFDENDNKAAANRAAFDAAGVVCVNLMSSPGSGKTAVLARTLDKLQNDIRIGVIEGDIETSLDADRLGGFGAQISLLNTGDGFGGECHLDAPMVSRALGGLDLTSLDLVLIENVGNLVCPAEFEVGEHHKAMVYGVTEGEDKPLKYPVMFRNVELVLMNKVDLLPYLDFDLELFEQNLRKVNPTATMLPVSAKTNDGLAPWFTWLRSKLKAPV